MIIDEKHMNQVYLTVALEHSVINRDALSYASYISGTLLRGANMKRSIEVVVENSLIARDDEFLLNFFHRMRFLDIEEEIQ